MKAKLELEYEDGSRHMRLLSEGKFTAGYTDVFCIQENNPDELGQPHWDTQVRFTEETPMFGLVKRLLRDMV